MNISPVYTVLDDVVVATLSSAYWVGGASSFNVTFSFSQNDNGVDLDVLGSVDGTSYAKILDTVTVGGGFTTPIIKSFENPSLLYIKVQSTSQGADTNVTAKLTLAGE